MPEFKPQNAKESPKAVHSTVESTARVRKLMDHWEAQSELGNFITAEELCKNDMDIIERVRDQIESLKSMTQIMTGMKPAQSADPGVTCSINETKSMNHETQLSEVDLIAAEGLGLIRPTNQNPVRENPRLIVGRYYLESFIAQGGHGQVWKAYDPELNRKVAIKLTRPERMARLKGHQRYVEQFRLIEEARKAARLKNPGIVTIYDVGIQDQLAFIVCELIEGEDLAQLLRHHKPTFAEAVRMCIEIAETLHFAHVEGFIHRDIKPANILIDKTGRLVISDFGIAATFEDLDRESGTVVGTPSYMAPEQALGRTELIGPVTDIYALAVIFYEMMTGKLPFENPMTSALIEAIVEKTPPSPNSIDPLIPAPLERVCMKALSKSVSERPKDALEFANSLKYGALISGIQWQNKY
jgi:tRNA A-37 threonylcarbamoyl transferase component Bud32